MTQISVESILKALIEHGELSYNDFQRSDIFGLLPPQSNKAKTLGSLLREMENSFIEESSTDKTPTPYIITNKGRNEYDRIMKVYQHGEEKENLEMQKLRGEVETLANKIGDYQTTKDRAYWARILAWLGLGLAAIDILLKLLWHKSD